MDIQQTNQILLRLHQQGYRAYYVGGVVRDRLLKRNTKDIDIVTSAPSSEVLKLFSKSFQMNNAHDTVIVRNNRSVVEITTERGESLKEDLNKRDFTINSLALSIDGEIIDYVGGASDLQKGIIRSNQPLERMLEDPLRMLRAVRFQSDLGFLIDEDLQKVIKKHANLIEKTALERVIKEFELFIIGSFRESVMKQDHTQKILFSLPAFKINEKTFHQLQKLGKIDTSDRSLIWAAFAIASQQDTYTKLPLSKSILKEVKKLMHFYYYREMNEWEEYSLYEASLEIAQKVEWLRQKFDLKATHHLEDMWSSLTIHSREDLCLDGHDLMKKLNKKPGPWIKEWLLQAEKMIICEKIPNEMNTLIDELVRRNAAL
ncbi:tRNA nucleotidyltransferas [Bacillus sp. TS-2]|nr:tRNA nucleotidyltransferas [Bacillus sp. TS-2]